MDYTDYPLIERMRGGEETLWLNPGLTDGFAEEVDIDGAAERLRRFEPYIRAVFPETDGIIESPLSGIPRMQERLEGEGGRLLIKRDSELPISGSIKARGGIYEVLCLAERVAIDNGGLKPADDYSVLAGERYTRLFSGYSVAVGSTGNLGLSIGIISKRLGFHVTVHMSADAKQWKKDLLREKGATVIEYAGDYEKAVAEGRRQAEADPRCHFVDDENSRMLFEGYAVAGKRLKAQLPGLGVAVDDEHPLFVYLPCGVGGGPGGVAYGIKKEFGANAHCFFAEPVEAPCMLLGLMTGQNEKISALDIGLSGRTVADGLAVTRPSGLVCRIAGNLLDGAFTVADGRMLRLVRELYETEGLFVEPSAAAGFLGYSLVTQSAEYLEKLGRKRLENATHVVWATGGGMVPENERRNLLTR